MKRDVDELLECCRLLSSYIREKTDQLLLMMGSKSLDASDLDDRTLVALDPIGTIAESFGQVLSHIHDVNEQLRSEIAERQRAEEALREKEGRYRTLAEFASDWVFWRGPDGNLVYVAPACEAITGYGPWEFYADPGLAESIIHPEDRGRWDAHRGAADVQKAAGTLEFRIRTKQGETRWIRHVCRPVYGADGAFLGVRGSNSNVTDRKRMEEEIQKASTLESIGVLAGGIAHDFNNILTAILGNISIARMELPPGGRVSARLDDAEKASIRARALTQQLLTFAKGGAPIRNPASAEELIRETATFALRGSNVRCDIDIPEDLRAVDVDEAQVGQVINNIIINAAQAMPRGGIVEVRAENVAMGAGAESSLPEGEYVKISVRDHGVGIPREDLGRIFNPFFTTKEKGTGLGLTTAFSIIRRHEGTIRAESEVGAGTTISIYLPAAARKPPGKSGEGQPVAGRGRVLVMDDEGVLRDLALEMLGMIGYEGAAEKDGAGALEAYRAAMEAGRPFDAVIMDLTVPGGMGGLEAVGKLLEIDPAANAIVSSGYSNDPVMSDFRRHGFRGVIAKPYRIQEIGEVLGRVLSARKRVV